MTGTRSHLTLEQKARLRHFLSQNPKLPQFQITDWVREQFHVTIGRATLYRIQHAPDSAFTGNLNRKKLRRVKFPEVEQGVLAYYHECRNSQTEITDDMMLRKAAECRDACGISRKDLKLSNGWLYRFKGRHDLGNTPRRASPNASNVVIAEVSALASIDSTSILPERQQVDVASADTVSKSCSEEQLIQSSSLFGSLLTNDISGNNINNVETSTFLCVKSIGTTQAPGNINWEKTSGQQDEQYFQIVNDGIYILQTGCYQINVDLEHTQPSPPPKCVFKVWSGQHVLDQCDAPMQCKKDLAKSVLTIRTMLSAQTLLKIDFQAPGYAFHDSRLVIRAIQQTVV